MTGVQLHAVALGYRGKAVVSDVSLAVAPGRIVALLGPNAAGKSTLLRAMGRQLKPLAGHITFADQDIWHMPPRAFARAVGYCPQGDGYDVSLTVEDVVAIGRAPHRGWWLPLNGDDRAAIARVLDVLGLSHVRHQAVSELSGGQKQRTALARVLVQEPSILLLDEPTAHLDPKHQVEFLSLLKKMTAAGAAAVISLHDLNQAAHWADDVVLLKDGHAFASGTPEAVLTAKNLTAVYDIAADVSRNAEGKMFIAFRPA